MVTYYVTSPEDPSVLLALDLQMEEGPGGLPVLSWSDTSRRRTFEVARFHTPPKVLHRANPSEIVFESQQGRTYTLVPLTLRLYNTHVRTRLTGQPVFSTDAEVQTFFAEDFGRDLAPTMPEEPPLDGTGFDALDSSQATKG